MRHRKKHKILDRHKSHRKALLINLAKSLFIYNKIKTRSAKAKNLRPFIEKLITLGKKNNLNTRRLLLRQVHSKQIANKILKDISPKYKDRKGGYTRIIKIGYRKGDGAEIVQIELL